MFSSLLMDSYFYCQPQNMNQMVEWS